MAMEKALLIEVFGSVTALGHELGIKSQAVSQWSEHIPEKQELRLRLRYPDINRRLARARLRLRTKTSSREEN